MTLRSATPSHWSITYRSASSCGIGSFMRSGAKLGCNVQRRRNGRSDGDGDASPKTLAKGQISDGDGAASPKTLEKRKIAMGDLNVPWLLDRAQQAVINAEMEGQGNQPSAGFVKGVWN